MKSFITSAALAIFVAATAANAAAIPSQIKDRTFDVALVFYGVDPDTSYFISAPADDQEFQITNPMSVSKISSAGGGFCTIVGADGSETVIVGEETVNVGPPQTQLYGTCDVL